MPMATVWRRAVARTGPDPLMDLTLPADGDYYLKVFDAVFEGAMSTSIVCNCTPTLTSIL